VSKNKTYKSRKAAKVQAVQQVDPKAERRSLLISWVLLAIVVLLAVAVRIHLLGIPLERDEGEYAYGGQLMLHGIPPYKLIYSMKFPGIYAAYAVMMAVFGQTIIGIHVGFMLVNAATIVLVYLLGKRLLTPVAGVAAAAAYALLSIGQHVLGTQAHATHFVVIAALGGTVLLLRGIESRRWPTMLWSGALFGIAVLMKQHGALFVVFGVFYLAWIGFTRGLAAWKSSVRDLAVFIGGVSIPLLLTGFALWCAGVFDKFLFWTFTYAHVYEQETPLKAGIDGFCAVFPGLVTPNLAIWIMAALGLILIWWIKDYRRLAAFLYGFLVLSFLAVCPGYYFRPHYFILMLPAVALLAATAVGILEKQWWRISWLAYGLTYGVFGAALVYSVVQQREFLFRMSPLRVSRVFYGKSPFPEAIKIADYIHAHTATGTRIAILGSEPEIPFYANRLNASGYIYMYGLMEDQPFAISMQDEFINDLETTKPDYVVFVKYQTSWTQIKEISSFKILHWWSVYQPEHYKQLVGVADIIDDNHTEYRWADAESYRVQSDSAVLIYKRTDGANDPTARLNPADARQAQEKLDQRAQENLQQLVVILNPDNYFAHNNLGIVLYTEGYTEEALKEFQRSLDINPNQALIHYDIGKIMMEKHKLPEAIDEFTQVLQFKRDDDHAHNDLGVALFQQGEYEDAAEQFRDALIINPANAEAKRNYDLAHIRMKTKK
jgi:tetratricopeptide (TPR) repeat protein/4-amino-4-deoxy-L-arabinose transferase-like glycosyltransferase